MILNFHERDNSRGFAQPKISCPICGIFANKIEQVSNNEVDYTGRVVKVFLTCKEGHNWTLTLMQEIAKRDNHLRAAISGGWEGK